MNRHLSHALSSVALVGSFALGAELARPAPAAAAPAQGGTPIERLQVLEKQVAALNAKIASFSDAKPGSAQAVASDTSGIKANKKQLEDIVAYLNAQAESAKRLEAAMDDAVEKGFTYGINPDSRVALLDGLGDLTQSLQTDLPTAEAAPVKVAQPGRVR